ncbi:sensor domain-containing diguanylate cyclase [uncultured Pseudoteredinibacter sp.]|uniref:sensor domain-containing diguanylate cyclase n=1 Tax=uncultured Pseudoteredinibacter sp. TaxID=1641701 RepID=UPI00262F84BE|nr:sensor domain-containing diguanylate cyclase [uncultured Pseudoteredinibacter sp.]
MLTPDHWVLEDKEGLVPLSKWQKTVDVMARIFSAPAGFIVQYSPDGYQVVIASDQESNIYPAGGLIPGDTNIFCRKIVETGTNLYVKNASKDPYWDDNPEVKNDGFLSYCGLPINWPNGDPFGTICVMDFVETDYQNDYIDLMHELRDLVEADLNLLDQYHAIVNMAMNDDLTKLNNRRGFLIAAKHRLALAKRHHHNLGLLYLDMDDLKVLNDKQGHKFGDNSLRKLAQLIKDATRQSDVAARIGGDEFVILSHCNGMNELNSLRDRIYERINSTDLSVSIGAVLIDDPSVAIEAWMDTADQAMYRVKLAKP